MNRTTTQLAALIAVALTLLTGAIAGSPPETFVAQEAADGDLFGTAVDVSSTLIAVGAYSTDLEREDVGVVYLFDTSTDDVAKVATLAAQDGELGDAFGVSVAVSGDTVLVGAPGVILSELNEGAAYLFEREGDTWAQVARLRRETTAANDSFGSSVDLDGAVAVVGAPGADVGGTDTGTALVYERLDGSWEQVTILTPQDAAAGRRFGSAVAVDGARIIVGASGDAHPAEDPGRAYIFERTSDGWQEAGQLAPSDGKGGDAFGDAVALAGDVALVGARFADLDGSDEGSAYVFRRTASGWEEQAKLTTPEPSDRDQFGHSVALAGDAAFVSAPRVDEPARDAGGVWMFRQDSEEWVMTNRLVRPGAAMYDEFGRSLAAHGSVVLAGAPQDIPVDETEETVTGTATLFRVQ